MKDPRWNKPFSFAAAAVLALGASAQDNPVSISIDPADTTAASAAVITAEHAAPLPGVNRPAVWAAGRPVTPSTAGALIPTIPPPGYYPGDVSQTSGGAVVTSARSHGLYVNCLPSCWGTPANFLVDLGDSDFIHVTDAYVGSTANNRYTVGLGAIVMEKLPHVLYDRDILAIVHAGAAYFGEAGYHNIYHVFLPSGTDVCFTGISPPECYSPDKPANFVFCAYHASADFPDVKHVLYTVEPYQNVSGCQVTEPSPNGPLIDSTADLLAHETFETITDPDGTAWWNNFDLNLYGAEIADECQNVNFDYGVVSLNRKNYEVQPMYSNTYHGCVFSPSIPPGSLSH